MKSLYDIHGLMFWNQSEIEIRERFIKDIPAAIERELRGINKAWSFERIEAPVLMPTSLLNPNYTPEDVWSTQDSLCLRPETTPGSYIVAKNILGFTNPPLCVWQAGKSFRHEQHDKSYVHMSLDEFWQMEFQLIYTEDTKFDYMQWACENLDKMIRKIICPYFLGGIDEMVRIIPSDRIPSYSTKTMDLEIDNGNKFLEMCSISQRIDFDAKHNGKNLNVLEIAFGLDRLVSVVNK